MLPNQWSLRPAGRQIELDDFPVNIEVHPDGRFAAVLHCGYSQHKISIIDLSSGKVVFKRGIEEAFYGLEFSARDLRLADLVVDDAAFVGDMLNFDVQLASSGYSGSAAVRLKRNGQSEPLAEQTVTLEPSGAGWGSISAR